MGYKKENIESIDSLQVPETLENFIEELPDRFTNGNINNIELEIDQEWNTFYRAMKKNNRLLGKKVVMLPLSVAAAFCLFIGSGFVSPAMAQIVSNIPYLNVLFESKPLFEEIKTALDEKNYQYGQLGVSIREKEVTVRFEGPVDYFNQVKSPVEQLVMDVLKERNNDAYKVRVFHQSNVAKNFPELDKKLEEESQKEYEKIQGIVGKILQQYGHPTNGIGVGTGIIHIDYIPNTEKRLAGIENQILLSLGQEQIKDYNDVKFYLYDPKTQEREGRFLPLYETITEGLTAKTEYKVDGTGYTNKKERFYIEIRTTITSTDSEKDELVRKIEKNLNDFLQSEEVQKTIQNDIYEIVILSKDKKKLKTIKN